MRITFVGGLKRTLPKLGFLCAAMLAIVARAATATISPQPLLYWTSETSFSRGAAGDPNVTGRIVDSDGGVYEFGIYLSASLSSSDLAAGFTGFGNAEFNVQLSGLQQSTTFPTYYGNPTTVLTNGNRAAYLDAFDALHTDGSGLGSNVNLFATNSDLGQAGDLKSIIVDVGTGTFTSADPHLTIGQSNQNSHLTAILGNPIQFGVIFVDWNGESFGTVSITQTAGDGFSLHNNTTGNNVLQTQGTSEVYRLGSYTFEPFIPEPLGIVTATLPLIALLTCFRRRRVIHGNAALALSLGRLA